MGGSEKVCERQLEAIINQIKIIKPKIGLINYINNTHNPTSNNMLSIADSGANIHLARKATPTMDPVIM